MIRRRAHLLQPGAQVRRRQVRIEALFELRLGRRARAGKPFEIVRQRRRVRRDGSRHAEAGDCGDECAHAARNRNYHLNLLYSRIPVPRFNRVTANANITAAAEIMMA